jgi:glycosyltransferase involved in cell wall biosynthesis
MKVINPRLDGVIAISSYLYDYYKKRGVHAVQIPPLVDTNDQKWKKEFHSSSKNIQLLYAGTPFSLYKEPSYKDRLDLIIKALNEIKKEHLFFQMHVIGIEKAEVLENFPELLPAMDFLDDSLKFYGQIPHPEVIKILKTVDYSLFLRNNSKSVKAGFPTKFVESISCGIPVLTNKNSNIGDYLKERVNGFWIEINSLDDMRTSLKNALSTSREQIYEMKKMCYDSKAFDYRKYIKLFKEFLEK